MDENKNLIAYKDSIFNKIKRFFKNIFHKKETEKVKAETTQEISYVGNTKKRFDEYISFKENKEELAIIDSIRKNPETLRDMSMEELDKIEIAIKNRQNFMDKKIAKLKNDLVMRRKGI